MENPTSSVTEEDFKPQRIKMKRGSTSGQTWEVDVGKEWVSSEHQAIGKQVTSDPLEKNKTRNTSRPWWIALETLKEMEDCLKKLDSGVARKRHSWATQQKAEVNKIELANQLKRSWQNLLKDHFEKAMRTPSSAPPLMANPFIRTAGQLMFAWSLLGIELETLTSYDKLKLGGKNLEMYRMLMQHVARDNSGLSLARRKDATCFLRWTMSMMTDSTILACHQRAVGSKTLERRVSTVILNVYQSTGVEKEDGSRQSLESHRKLDEIRRFYNKKFEEKHDVHRNLASSGKYLKLNKKGEYQYVSGVMGMAYNPFLDLEAGGAHRNYEVAELLKFWTEKIMEIDTVERERPSLGLILERTPEVISVPRSSKRVELKMGNGNGVLTTNLGVVWKLLRPSWCPHPHASLIEEGLGSPSADAVSEKDLRETAPMVLARWKTAVYKSNYEPRKLLDIEKEMENPTSSVTEEDFKPQRIKMKRGSTSGQTWEVDVGKEWVSSEHQAIGKQVTSDPLEKNKTRNTSRPWWIALETFKEMEDCLKKLDSGVARKRHSWATQQKAEVNKIELANQLKRSWQNLLKDHFEKAMRTPSSAPPLMANPFIRTAGQLMFAWSLLGIELETLTSYDKLKLGGKNLEMYRMLMQHVARDNSGLSLARRKDATCFLRWTMSMITDSTILACHQRAVGSKTLERRVSTVILNVYQSTGVEKEDGSRQSLESHRKLDEIRRFYNKKFEEKHDVHRNLASSGKYLKLNKKGEYQYVSGVMGMAYNPFLDLEAGGAHRNYEVAELLKFWTEKIMEIDTVERERPSLGLILERTPEVISVPRSSKRVELKMGNGNGVLTTNLGVVWKLLRPSWCPHPHASLIEEVTERVRLAPTEDEDLATLSIVHRLILPQMKESSEVTSGTGSVKRMEPGSCLDSTCGNGEHTCDGRSCVRIQSFQKEDLITWFEDITEREKSEIQIVAECYASSTVNLATDLGFFSRMCSLQSLERLESEHHLVTALSVESWPGVLQVNQKHIKSWKIGLEAEMGFPMSEAYGLPLNAKSLVGSVLANLCGSHYPLHMAMIEVSSQRVLIDKAFSVPKCVRLAQISHHSHKLLRKIRGAVPKEQRDDLSEIWGEELLGLESENTSDHGRQNVVGKPAVGAPSSEEVDVIHEKMMELEPLLEASGERNLRSIDLTHGDCPCHCLAQTVWYPDRANLCLIWDRRN